MTKEHIGQIKLGVEEEESELMKQSSRSWNETNCNTNNNKLKNEESSVFSDIRPPTAKRLRDDSLAKTKYLLKPAIFIVVGTALICAGIVLTVSHFLYEDTIDPKKTGPKPYFTYGPISFASGFILFMIGIIWFSIKHMKWMTGTASPIASAAASAAMALATSATMTSDQLHVPTV